MRSLEERFWSKVDKSGSCWLWKASCYPTGYGAFGSEKVQRAHRVAWELTFGKIPDGLYVLHHCDNPPCVNPNHLWLGTQADNLADMVKKGRAIYGEAIGNSKLTTGNVLRIRELRTKGMSVILLARLFGISHQHVSKIVLRKRWAWI